MLSEIATILKRMFAVIRFGLLTLRYAGLNVALQKLGHQIYGRTIFVRYVIDVGSPTPTPKFPSYMVRASEKDLKELFEQVQHESNEGKYQLLIRKWYHDRGIGTPYIQKKSDTNEICGILWVVRSQDLEKSGFKDRFPMLQDNESMIENAYTLERFRGKGVQNSTRATLQEILINSGIKRNKGSIDESNISAMRLRAKNPSTKAFERVLERHFLFRVSHKVLERYNPPIPFSDLVEN